MPTRTAMLFAASLLCGLIFSGAGLAHAAPGKSMRKMHSAHPGRSGCPAPTPDHSYPTKCKCQALGIPEFIKQPQCTSRNNTLAAPGITDPNYDPSAVDWTSLMKSVEYIAGQEPRVCNMAIRAHFHDALSHTVIDGVNYGSDGSLMMDAYEFANPTDAADAFAMLTRAVVVQLSFYYSASLADTLNVLAFTCVSSLGAVVPIPEQCAQDGLDLKVGKLDAPYQFTNALGDKRTSHLPGGFDFASFWLNFFFVDLNGGLPEGSKFRFKLDDAIALMGSHGNIQDVACMQTGSEVAGITSESQSVAKCNGKSRVFYWDNSYFQDSNSGSCTPRQPASNPKGTSRDMMENMAVDTCVFAREQTQELRDQLVCQIKAADQELGIPPSPPVNGVDVATHQMGNAPLWRHVDWAPNEKTRAPCCGYVCPLCADNENAFYCASSSDGSKADPETTYWPYTWNDCDLAFAAQQGSDKYCAANLHGAACTSKSYLGAEADLKSYIDQMPQYYSKFASDNTAWQQAYARGHCKMNNYGAVYSNKATKLLPLLSKPSMADPSPAGVLPSHRCARGKCVYDLNTIVTPKECLRCNSTTSPMYGPPATVFPQPQLTTGPGQLLVTDVFGGAPGCVAKAGEKGNSAGDGGAPANSPHHKKEGKHGRKHHKKEGKHGKKHHKKEGKHGKKHHNKEKEHKKQG